MKYNLIWDLDGTIFDSYPVIIKVLKMLYVKYDIEFIYEDVYRFVIENSVTSLIEKVSSILEIDYQDLKSEFSLELQKRNDEIKLMENVVEVLQCKDIRSFVITNKSNNALILLDNLKIRDYFIEIITSSDNFNKKPDPEAINYLVSKYKLDKSCTYYVGDRPVDYRFAINSEVNSINFHTGNVDANYKINNLIDIKIILDL